jgi:hypothetical protein
VTLPIPSNVFADGELTNEASWYARIFSAINTIYQQAAGTNFGEAEGTSGNSVTLSSGAGGTNYLVPGAAVTATLATQRRVRIIVTCHISSGTAVGGYYPFIGYVTGSTATLTGVTLLGNAGANQVSTVSTGGTGAQSGRADHTVLLPAGTYTFFPVVQKAAGGSATDTANLGYCAVYDAGGS